MEQLAKMADQLRVDRRAPGRRWSTETADYEKLRAENAGQAHDRPAHRRPRPRPGPGGAQGRDRELIEKLEGAPVFALTLKRAADGMETAAQRLQALKTDETTQRAAALGRRPVQAAPRRPQARQAPRTAGSQQQGGGGEGGGGGGGGGGDGIPPAAQVKMLKALQEEINERTEYFDELNRRGKELDPEQTAELDRLHDDQGTLADLVRDLTRPKKDDGED